MHELSIVANLFEILNQKAKEKKAKRILSVTLQVGRLSGVVPELLRSSFDIYKQDTLAHNADLEIREVPFKVRCLACGTEMIKEDFIMVCDRCRSTELETLQGTELFLLKMDVEA